MTNNYRIVVGVDGSDGGRRALRWAVHEAAARHGTVQAINAWRWDSFDLPPHASTSPDEERARAETVLDREVATVSEGGIGDGVSIASEVVEGRAAEVLTEAARDADLLVVGSHGHSRVWHTVLGSVSAECVQRANCPVVVLPVPSEAGTTGRPAVPATVEPS